MLKTLRIRLARKLVESLDYSVSNRTYRHEAMLATDRIGFRRGVEMTKDTMCELIREYHPDSEILNNIPL